MNYKLDLIHLDLSYNNITYDTCKILALGLKKNHSIYGLHFAGNYGKIDEHGFL